MWQTKDLWEAVFGSVANKGVMGKILEVWQRKELFKERLHVRGLEGLNVEEKEGGGRSKERLRVKRSNV